jgi:plasmid stabilization system protein ParE
MPRKFLVVLATKAESDLLAIREFIAADKPKAAYKWYRKIKKEILSLASFPLRYEIIPEADDLEVPYRHQIYGSYRAIFRVDGQVVNVLRVVHAARLLDPDTLA